jgi:hypothetical protein
MLSKAIAGSSNANARFVVKFLHLNILEEVTIFARNLAYFIAPH